MPAVIRTVYSNVVDIQTSDTELILAFGSDFSGKPIDESKFVPEVRVVLPKEGAAGLIAHIQEAIESERKRRSSKQGGRAAAARRRAK